MSKPFGFDPKTGNLNIPEEIVDSMVNAKPLSENPFDDLKDEIEASDLSKRDKDNLMKGLKMIAMLGGELDE